MNLVVRDAARLLDVSEKTIYRWIRKELIPAYRVNGQFRLNRAELLEWATARRVSVSPEIFAEDDVGAAPPPELSEALEAGGISYRVEGTDKPSVLRAVVGCMRLPDEVDREFLLEVLLARETLASTGIGGGIAVPHVRNPIVLHLNRPTITLCFLERPVDFGALDGKPVSVLFTLISPSVRAHLHMLSRLCFALRDAPLRQALTRQAPRDEVFAAVRRAGMALAPPQPAGVPA